MSNETIELLKNYEPTKMPWPALHQQKIDGVPVRVIKQADEVRSYTRQGERVTSIPHIEQFCSVLLKHDGDSVVMELHIAGKAFKEISGLVRRKVACRELRGWVFDCDWITYPGGTYRDRMLTLAYRLGDIATKAGSRLEDFSVRLIPGVQCADADEAQDAHDALMLANPDAEGSVIHSLSKTFQPGKRFWGTQRMKPVPTIDLRIVGFEEAISESGAPLRMIGRINAEFNKVQHGHNQDGSAVTYTPEIIGIGPGALNHTQRKLLWAEWINGRFKPRIAEIRYMRDDSYDSLRQPTFKCWRDDKVEADTHAN